MDNRKGDFLTHGKEPLSAALFGIHSPLSNKNDVEKMRTRIVRVSIYGWEGTAAFVPKKYKVIFYDRFFSGARFRLTEHESRLKKKQVIIRTKFFDNNKEK